MVIYIYKIIEATEEKKNERDHYMQFYGNTFDS